MNIDNLLNNFVIDLEDYLTRDNTKTYKEIMKTLELNMIKFLLRSNKNNIKKVYTSMGMSRMNLYQKLKGMGYYPPRSVLEELVVPTSSDNHDSSDKAEDHN